MADPSKLVPGVICRDLDAQERFQIVQIVSPSIGWQIPPRAWVVAIDENGEPCGKPQRVLADRLVVIYIPPEPKPTVDDMARVSGVSQSEWIRPTLLAESSTAEIKLSPDPLANFIAGLPSGSHVSLTIQTPAEKNP